MERLTTNSLPSGLRMSTITRRSLLRSAVGLAAAGAITPPYIARAQQVIVSDYWHRAPRNVVFYNATNPVNNSVYTDLTQLRGLPYTDVNLAFLIPGPGNSYLTGDNTTIWGDNNDLNSNTQLQELIILISYLRNVNQKNVLLSVGGQLSTNGWTPAKWQYYASSSANLTGLVNEINAWVRNLGASGVDIDFEDDGAFYAPGSQNYSGYNGVDFLSELTMQLAAVLPPTGNIITHTPPAPFWDNTSQFGLNFTQYDGAYLAINKNVGQYIAWYNTQFYGDPGPPPYDTDLPSTINNSKVNLYNKFVAEGVNPEKLILGVLIDPNEPNLGSLNVNVPGDFADLGNNVINPLKAEHSQFAAQFGGVMVFQFADDYQGQDVGVWANGIASALYSQVQQGLGDYVAAPYINGSYY